MAASRENGIADEVVDQLLAGRDPATVFESGGLVDELKKRLAERMLNGEMDRHLGGEAEEQAGNHRNGYSSKTVLTDSGLSLLKIPSQGKLGLGAGTLSYEPRPPDTRGVRNH